MSDDLKKAKKQLELKRVKLGLEEQKFKILERKADIERIEENMVIQQERINTLEEELKEDNNGN